MPPPRVEPNTAERNKTKSCCETIAESLSDLVTKANNRHSSYDTKEYFEAVKVERFVYLSEEELDGKEKELMYFDIEPASQGKVRRVLPCLKSRSIHQVVKRLPEVERLVTIENRKIQRKDNDDTDESKCTHVLEKLGDRVYFPSSL
eukprot:CAMPEP_0201518806 /NCGR_PEP_ID=MMETSP0161_2-20130828/9542_1 /ASSEMBLY_ACC=CAM_ASM_000251 /TAXON_ID=180227 /ORGANISM="Neoparamoeba aestuarina, Strain SoJaBio B1-5/56/2" /LENGTH=146 /DNA_ID=CAMNT_0047916675 /DNA_START=309 /DNA_END=747 /DNA_ORIENTATION=+